MHKRSFFGIGHLFFAVSLIYSLIILNLDHLIFDTYRFTSYHNFAAFFIGITLIITGIAILVFSLIEIKKAFTKNKLTTSGVYSFIRHPIYGAWIVFIVPGIVIIDGQLLGLTIPIAMYFIFRVLIKKEEQKLLDLFGSDYQKYMKNVNAIFPKLHRRY
jgi:protein-S-isoprenylcysteine O-methyltransferase Ste14